MSHIGSTLHNDSIETHPALKSSSVSTGPNQHDSVNLSSEVPNREYDVSLTGDDASVHFIDNQKSSQPGCTSNQSPEPPLDTDEPDPCLTTQIDDVCVVQRKGGWWNHAVFMCNVCHVYSISKTKIMRHCRAVHNMLFKNILASITTCQPLDGESCSLEMKTDHGQPSKKTNSEMEGNCTNQNKADSSESGHPVKRKRGRPRKSEQVTSKSMLAEEVIQTMSGSVKTELKCDTCHRQFTRERQLRSHKCLTEFVDDVFDKKARLFEPTHLMSDGMVPIVQGIDEQTCNLLMHSLKNLPGTNGDAEVEGMVVDTDKFGKEHEIIQVINENKITPSMPSTPSLKLWTCPHCAKLFKFKYSMQVHIRSHTNTKPFKCSKCNYASTNKGNLTVHMQKHSGIQLRCAKCSYTCFSKGHLKTHMKSHSIRERVICELCDRNLYAISNLIKHLDESHDLTVPQNLEYYRKKKLECRLGRRTLLYQCIVCNRKFKSKKDHDTHILLHKDKKPFGCTLCDYSCVKESYLAKHVKRHRYIYQCSVCQQRFLSSILLKEHLMSHCTDTMEQLQTDQLFQESISCSIYLAEAVEEDLREMNNKNMGEQKNREKSVEDEGMITQTFERSDDIGINIKHTPSQQIVGPDVLSKFGECFRKYEYRTMNLKVLNLFSKMYGQYECRYCGRFMYFKPSFVNHVKTHLEAKAYKCQNCSYASHSKEGLKRHDEKMHRGIKYECDECGFVTNVKYYLQQHIRKHMRKQEFACTLCSTICNTEQTTKDHILEKHPDITPDQLEKIFGKRTHILNKPGKKWHTCQYCGKEFRKVCKFRQHLWAHKGVNPYKCSICGHGTRTGSNLKTHMLKHSDVKNHLCDECGKAFKTKHALKVHNQVAHRQDSNFRCQYCNYTGVKVGHLERHLDMHSGLKPYRCLLCANCTVNSKGALRTHYNRLHPSDKFDDVEVEKVRLQNVLNAVDVTNVTSYQCSHCENVFCNKHDLKQHLTKKHKEDLVNIQMTLDGVSSEQTSTGESAAVQNESQQIVDAEISEERNAINILQQLIQMHEHATCTAGVISVTGHSMGVDGDKQEGNLAVLHEQTLSNGSHVKIFHSDGQTQLVSLGHNEMQIVNITDDKESQMLSNDGQDEMISHVIETCDEEKQADDGFQVAEMESETIVNEDLQVHPIDQGVRVQEEEVVTAAESIVATDLNTTEAYVVDGETQQLIVLASSDW